MGGKPTKQTNIHSLKRTQSRSSDDEDYNDIDGNFTIFSYFVDDDTMSMSPREITYSFNAGFDPQFCSYHYIDGRRFYKDAITAYILPSDAVEVQRTEFAHELLKVRWRNNFSSPVKNKLLSPEGGRVLDCGCGSGKWAYEMAIKYPSSTFVGLDMAPVFSRINNHENKPLNLGFLEHNMCNGLPFQDATFDFIFQRSMILSLNIVQWNMMMNEFARTIKPGGWLELMELRVNELNITTTAKLFQGALNRYLKINGQYCYNKFPFHELLKTTNQFTSIRVFQKQMAIGSWGGELGLKLADICIEVYKGLKPTIKPILNTTDPEYDELIQKLAKELKNPLNNMYVSTVRAIAMKI